MPRRVLINKIYAFLETIAIILFWTLGWLPPSPCPAPRQQPCRSRSRGTKSRTSGDISRTSIAAFVLRTIGDVNRKRIEERERDSKEKYHGETDSR